MPRSLKKRSILGIAGVPKPRGVFKISIKDKLAREHADLQRQRMFDRLNNHTVPKEWRGLTDCTIDAISEFLSSFDKFTHVKIDNRLNAVARIVSSDIGTDTIFKSAPEYQFATVPNAKVPRKLFREERERPLPQVAYTVVMNPISLSDSKKDLPYVEPQVTQVESGLAGSERAAVRQILQWLKVCFIGVLADNSPLPLRILTGQNQSCVVGDNQFLSRMYECDHKEFPSASEVESRHFFWSRIVPLFDKAIDSFGKLKKLLQYVHDLMVHSAPDYFPSQSFCHMFDIRWRSVGYGPRTVHPIDMEAGQQWKSFVIDF